MAEYYGGPLGGTEFRWPRGRRSTWRNAEGGSLPNFAGDELLQHDDAPEAYRCLVFERGYVWAPLLLIWVHDGTPLPMLQFEPDWYERLRWARPRLPFESVVDESEPRP